MFARVHKGKQIAAVLGYFEGANKKQTRKCRGIRTGKIPVIVFKESGFDILIRKNGKVDKN